MTAVELAAGTCPIAADPAHYDLAVDYAARTPGRRVVPLADLSAADTPHLLVIAGPQAFRRPLLDELTVTVPGLLGLVTGRTDQDLAAFLVAQRAPSTPGQQAEALLLDELYGSSLRVRPNLLESAAFPELIDEDELLGRWGLLALHVHGEGAHANLRSTVLCGQGPAGASDNGGCSPRDCKRASHTGGRFRTFSELTAEQVMFLSCSGLSVSQEHFPSSNSAALSLIASGQVRTAICNDRTVPLSPEEVRLAFRVGAGEGLAAACAFLNDIAMPRFSGSRPWLMLGDPLACGRPVSAEPLTHRQPLGNGDDRLLSIRGTGAAAVAIAGADLVVESPDVAGGAVAGGAVAELAVQDRTEQVRRLERDLRHALTMTFVSSLAVDVLTERVPAEGERIAVLEQLTSNVRVGVGRALQSARAWRRNRIVPEQQAAWLDRAGRLLDLSRRSTVAALLPLLDHGVEEVLENLGLLADVDSSQRCERCEARLSKRAGQADFTGGPAISMELCVTCGPRRIVVGTPPAGVLRVSPVVDRDELALSFGSADTSAWSALSMRDKARGVNVLRAGPVPTVELGPVLPLGQDLSPDLHTIRVVTAHAGGLCLDRRRTARRFIPAAQGLGMKASP